MRRFLVWIAALVLMSALSFVQAQEGLIRAFRLEDNPLTLERLARPGSPFDKVGRKFAILADESGTFEAWAYPLKLFRNFTLSFLVGDSTRPIRGKDIIRLISVTPEATILTYTYQSFTVKAIYITPINEPGAIVLLQVDSNLPLTVVCGFFPVLQPMWPAGLGGQYAYWEDGHKAYIISESKGQNHGIIGSPAAQGISYTPAHMLSDSPNEFNIKIPDPDKVREMYIPIIMAGGEGKREKVLEVYTRLKNNPEKYYSLNLAHYQNLRTSTLQVKTPCSKLNLAFEWAKVAYDNLMVDNPDLGKGLVAGLGASGTSGRPGFGWFFGGDTYINSFSLLSFGAHNFTRNALAFTQKWQRKDGKMAHELSQAAAYIDWWNDYHYGYIHGDTTPYYIAAVYDYVKKTGDIDFVLKSWESLKLAFEWCLSTDANQDGLMDNQKAGLGALEYGALTGIETDIYLASVWVRAAYAMQHLAEIADDKKSLSKAKEHFNKAKRTFDEKFWDEENRFYAYAFNSEGETVKERSPWNAIGLMWNLGSEERSLLSLEKLSSAEITTDWGTRSISVKSKYFQPLNYNYGAVWPFLTSWVTTALYKHHMPLQGYSLLMSAAQHTYENALGCITEVFSGTNNIWPQEAVSHQGFSTAAAVLPLVRGLLGLEGDALNKSLIFSPHFPAAWNQVSISNYRVGQANFSLEFERSEDKIVVKVYPERAQGYTLRFTPALGIGTRVQSLKANGEPVEFKTEEKAQVVLVESEIPVKEDLLSIEITFLPTVEILPVVPESQTGDSNKGLKIISLNKESSRLIIEFEGLTNATYHMRVTMPEFIAKVDGAEVKKDKLILTMPEGKLGNFVPKKIAIFLQNTSK
jgi:glycogen debranching enzyme